MMRKIFFAFIIFGVSLMGLDNFSVAQRLQKAMDEKNFQTVSTIVESGDINRTYYLKEHDLYLTPLTTAIFINDRELFKILLQKGADINQTDPRGLTPLFFALRTLENYYLKELLKRGVSLEPIKGQSPLLYVILDFNFVSKIKLLLHADIDKNYKDKDGKSVLELFKEKYKLYDEMYNKIESSTAEQIQKMNLNSYYKQKVLEKNGKQNVLKSIEMQKIFISRAIEFLR